MKIAITCENGSVFQHFGHTPEFAVFEIENGKITASKMLSSGGSGHGALATLLTLEQVDVLICGGIGGGAINALGSAGIEVIGGAEGDVRQVAEAFAAGTLQVRQDFHCNHHHHGEGHDCGSHSCGSGNCSH
ncbi:MAG: dinitrogenase iron-molybdenum cofactor biosynthesis protein [Lentisphaerae bacterium]|nr:dinitrogenase iron-molybdenum cofactor biosynthesis protein [Lentisphaerota bacterium]